MQTLHYSLSTNHHSIRASSIAALEVLQVYPPVLTVNPEGVLEITDGSSNASVAIVDDRRPSCQQTLVSYSFANSYGNPFVGNYAPPACSFDRVTWNLTVTSIGRQFDRLAIVYLGDVEVFRTSTAEPTTNGIRWVYLKDMTPYVSLFAEQQTVIFDLGNIVNDVYTGPFNVTLTASYFNADDSIKPADLIVPISSRASSGGRSSVFTLPPDIASNNVTLPRNIQRAVVTISATGQIDEEFWWSNVPSSTVNTFPEAGTLLGYSPFREVQLFIDGTLAGVAWPFPIIFTGGVVPGLWRPIVGIDAFDLKEDEIDVTPWLPILCDGKSHNFTIRVAGLQDDGKGSAKLVEVVGSYWLVTGKIFVWLDEDGSATTGMQPTIVAPPPSLEVTASTTTNSNGSNATLQYQVNAARDLSFSALISTSQGQKFSYWQQTRKFSNTGTVSQSGNAQTNVQSTTGTDISSSGYVRRLSYPLTANTLYTTAADSFSITANISRGKDVQNLGQPVFPTGLESFTAGTLSEPLASFQGALLQTSQNGSATYFANTTSSTAYSYGSTVQDMTFSGVSTAAGSNPYATVVGMTELFTRQIAATNGTVLYDHERLVNQTIEHQHGISSDNDSFVLSGRPQHLRGY
ncbi:hypothetical protein AMS68_003423 [Peltaster fructicola]|uniref:Peptide N-acetyl-beta-D-glucosaminyl asparaginase amidase A N-terminal domain-containing protein n=1 Tax=Peltaster fructicola TaxID=286661 RepID=A0A6H0XTA9_9PEZI|nr:hypothetical protein AMS68_003423 [Peltaster fructicola]